MPEADRRNKERDLANVNREYQRAQRQMREDLSLRQNDEVAALQLTATKAIQVIAEAEKYDSYCPCATLFTGVSVLILQKRYSRRWLTNSFVPAGTPVFSATAICC